ncbi:MAG: RNA methyltransferase [Candidatus Eisenbacteria bacterium]|nr:RNA methyltransferase [Candidatus Eisenbacteria bacterium]
MNRDFEPETLRSATNPALQRVRLVASGKDKSLILLEGERLIDEAHRAHFEIESLFVDEERPELQLRWQAAGLEPRRVARGLLERLGTLAQSPGCLALARVPPERELDDLLSTTKTGLVVVAAGIGDPGNLGALARSAEAAGAGALIVTPGGASPWNEKALRGSMGSLLRLPVARPPSASAAASALARLGFRQVRAATRGGLDYRSFDWRGRLVLWLSSETGALPPEAEGFEGVSIPMLGATESLNVGAAAAILLFTAATFRSG